MRIRGKWVVLVCSLGACGGQASKGQGGDASTSTTTGTHGSGGGPTGSGGSSATTGSGGQSGSSGSPSGVGGAPTTGGAAGSPTAGGGTDNGGSGGSSGSGGNTGGTGGSTSDEICEWGWYDTDTTDDVLTCEEWTKCQPGEYMESQGGFVVDNVCEPCASGTFSDEVGSFRCDEWHACEFGEQVAVEPSPTNDRSCERSELFPPKAGEAVGLTLTSDGPELLVFLGIYPHPPEASLLSYSLEGELLGDATVSVGTSTGTDELVVDMASIGDDIFLAGVKYAGQGVRGFVRMPSADGETVWETPLGALSDYFSALVLSGRGNVLYAAAEVYPEDESGPVTMLYGLDPADGSLDTLINLGNLNGPVNDVEIASNGNVFLAGVSPEVPGYDSILEVTPEGMLVAEHELGGHHRTQQLAADDSGGVFVLAVPYSSGETWPSYLMKFTPSLEYIAAWGMEVEQERDWQMEALTLSPDAALVVGRTPEHPVLATVDLNDAVTSNEVLEDIAAPFEFVGVRQAPNGTVFVAGTNLNQGNVDPIAFVAPWPQ